MKPEAFKPQGKEIPVSGGGETIEQNLGRQRPWMAPEMGLSGMAVPTDKSGRMSGPAGAHTIPVAGQQGPTQVGPAPAVPVQPRGNGPARVGSPEDRFSPSMGAGQPAAPPARGGERFVPSAEGAPQPPMGQPRPFLHRDVPRATEGYVVRLEGVAPDGQTYYDDVQIDFPVGTRLLGAPKIVQKL